MDKLAGHLALSTNWQIPNVLKSIRGSWLSSDLLAKAAESEQISDWKEQVNRILSPGNELDLVCESYFLIYLASLRGDHTNAFVQFAQTLERLLSLRSKMGDWQGIGYISSLEYPGAPPKFKELNKTWYERFNSQDNWYRLLEEICKKRNGIVHEAKSLTVEQLRHIWTDKGFSTDSVDEPTEMMKPMMNVLRKVCDRNWSIPEKPLL